MTSVNEALSRISGLSRERVDGIWADVKANHARLLSCKTHRFPDAVANPPKFGGKVKCERCEGVMSLTDASHYFDGFAAAGGDPNDVWPGFTREKT